MGIQQADTAKVRKARLRKELLKQRAGFSGDYCQLSDSAIGEQFLKMPEYVRAKVLFMYVSIEGEVDTKQLIFRALEDKKFVAVPKCVGKGIMRAYYIQKIEDLKPGMYGILEPKEYCEEVDPEKIELAVIPCISCDKSGTRLGYGGGYYDRYLPMSLGLRVLLCRERLMCEEIPQEFCDCKMDRIVTENEIICCSRFRRH